MSRNDSMPARRWCRATPRSSTGARCGLGRSTADCAGSVGKLSALDLWLRQPHHPQLHGPHGGVPAVAPLQLVRAELPGELPIDEEPENETVDDGDEEEAPQPQDRDRLRHLVVD